MRRASWEESEEETAYYKGPEGRITIERKKGYERADLQS
jgi:hypothetical protein